MKKEGPISEEERERFLSLFTYTGKDNPATSLTPDPKVVKRTTD